LLVQNVIQAAKSELLYSFQAFVKGRGTRFTFPIKAGVNLPEINRTYHHNYLSRETGRCKQLCQKY